MGITSGWGVSTFEKGSVDPKASCRVCNKRQTSHFQSGRKKKTWARLQNSSPSLIPRPGKWDRKLTIPSDRQWLADGGGGPLPSGLRSASNLHHLTSECWCQQSDIDPGSTPQASCALYTTGADPRESSEHATVLSHSYNTFLNTLEANLSLILPDVLTCRQMFIISNS